MIDNAPMIITRIGWKTKRITSHMGRYVGGKAAEEKELIRDDIHLYRMTETRHRFIYFILLSTREISVLRINGVCV